LRRDGGETWKILDTAKMPSAKPGEAAFAASGTCLITNGKSNVFLSFRRTGRARFSLNAIAAKTGLVADTPIIKGTAGSGIFSIAMRTQKTALSSAEITKSRTKSIIILAFTKTAAQNWTLGKGLNGYRSGVAYVDRKTFVAVGSSGSDLSIDGGKTWRNLDKENYNAVQSKGGKTRFGRSAQTAWSADTISENS
jgi:photosystem II stability/assembly factor-like uncharacterized protein